MQDSSIFLRLFPNFTEGVRFLKLFTPAILRDVWLNVKVQ